MIKPVRMLLVKNISELATFEGTKALAGEEMSHAKRIRNAWILSDNGIIMAIGSGKAPAVPDVAVVIDAAGKLALPGFVDSHTHFLFAGDRIEEYNMRLQGATYEEIMAAGGGIANSVTATRQASKEELYKMGIHRLDEFLAQGVTIVEGKSGYGLDQDTELTQLNVMEWVHRNHPVDVVKTYMGAHDIPQGMTEDEAIDFQIDTMLPLVKEQGFAQFVDIFTEKGVFGLESSRRYLEKAKELGFLLKVHADEIVPLGGAQLAAQMGAVSAEHLLQISPEGIEALAKSGTIAALLPLTAFSLKKNYAPARELIQKGVPVALASDFNPGSSPSMSVSLIIALATHYMGMSMEQTLCALTLNGAAAVGMANKRGSLEIGKSTDIVLHDVETLDHLSYHFGVNSVDTVISKGNIVYEKRRSYLR